MSKKTLSVLALVLGLCFFALAVFYWITPAGNLPSILPGYIAGSSVIHLKHALASLVVGLALLAYAWFASGKKQQAPAQPLQ